MTMNHSMKKNIILLTLGLLAAGVVHAAETNAAPSTSALDDALTRLKGASNYTWTVTLKIPNMPFEPGQVKGTSEKDGFSKLSQQFNDNTIEAVMKGGKIAVKGENGWELLDKAEGPSAMMGSWLTANGTADVEAAKLLKSARELKPGEGGVYSGEFTTEGAKELMTSRARGGFTPPPPKNAKGSVKFWIKDNTLSKFESHLQASMSFGPDQEERDFEMTRTVEIQNVGATKVEVPEEAKKLMEGK
jgi:hypothetical protein